MLETPRRIFCILIMEMPVGIITNTNLYADDEHQPPASVRPTTTEKAASALTERERSLLDRVEQLEKRVNELESRTDTRPANANPEPTARATASERTSSTASTALASNSSIAGQPQPISVTNQSTPGKPEAAAPFAFADFTWLNGNARTKESPMDTKFFTPEVRADVGYVYSFNHPKDDTIGGSSEVFRHGEVQLTQLGVGGDFHYDNVRARVMTQFGLYSQTTARNDASPPAANGISTMLTVTFPKPTADITST